MPAVSFIAYDYMYRSLVSGSCQCELAKTEPDWAINGGIAIQGLKASKYQCDDAFSDSQSELTGEDQKVDDRHCWTHTCEGSVVNQRIRIG